MNDPTIEQTLWHPVALSHTVGSQPQAANLLGQPLVLWRDGDGAAHAWADQCPHRGARLSLGRVHAGQLECPYHGWRFEGGGACTHVPAVPDFKPGVRHSATVFATREAYGTALRKLGAVSRAVVALDGDVKNSTFSEYFADEYPERFTECYIAEQNMIGVAMGLAAATPRDPPTAAPRAARPASMPR